MPELLDGLHHLPANERVSRLANYLFLKRNISMYAEAHRRVTPMMCWDAALYCAWLSGGIDVPLIAANPNATSWSVLGQNKYEGVFKVDQRQVKSIRELERLPPGCLIGFIGRVGGQPNTPMILRHVMLHINGGLGAGTKNGCIYPASGGGGWEAIDMTEFFGPNAFNKHTTMVYEPCNGQRVYGG